MLICKECGHVFSEDDAASFSEDRGFIGNVRAYESVTACPSCGSDDIAEAELCPVCDEFFNAEDIRGLETSEGLVCPDCSKQIKMKFDALILNEFSPAEKAVLRAFEEDGGLI